MRTTGVCFAAVLVAAVAVVAPATSDVLGVQPAFLHHYKDTAKFMCIDGSKTIDYSMVNDDYCDCEDGSDEPGTAGCLNGTFYCKNDQHLPQILTSVRVDDGICDCCDGTDEFRLKCPNTCFEAGREERERVAQEAEMQLEGGKVKESYIQEAVTGIPNLKTKLAKLEADIEALRPEVDGAKVVKEEQDKIEQEEKDALKKVQEEEEAKKEEEKKKAEEEEEKRKAEEALDEPLGALAEEVAAQDEATLSEEEAAPATPETPADASASHTRPEAEAARDELSKLETRLRELERERDTIQKTLGHDFGHQGEFFALHTQCFSADLAGYIYEVCPYETTSQKGRDGGGRTSLGKWDSWKHAGINDYKTMQFKDGDKCWNGPARSATVHLSCGKENRVLSAIEPEMCSYDIKYETPAACSSAHQLMEEMNLEVAEGENN